MDKEEFINICLDRSFWKHLLKDSLIPYKRVRDKRDLIEKLFDKIRMRQYYPSPPTNYLILNKGKCVLRVVPVFGIEDLCVYFYCTRKLEKYIAENRTPGTYGGWLLSGETRIAEEIDLSEYDKDAVRIENFEGDRYVYIDIGEYNNETNFNPSAWVASWNNFTMSLYNYSVDSRSKFVAELDISNFYDSIRLDHLEFIIRNNVHPEDNQIVYLLFHLLRYWNRHSNFYVRQVAGLPQDLFGECSRILANFYLQSYDRQMKELCDQHKAKYFRYADDQIVFADSVKDLNLIVAKASSYLMRIGLNLNQKKVNFMTRGGFDTYFAFEPLIHLGGKGSSIVSGRTVDDTISYYLANRNSLRANGRTLLRAILSCASKSVDKINLLGRLIDLIVSQDFLETHPPSFKDYKKIYAYSDTQHKKRFLSILKLISKDCLHTDFLYHYQRFLQSQGIPHTHVKKEIDRVNTMYRFNLK